MFDFRGTDIDLPPGIVDAVVTGMLTDGTTFASTFQVFNRDESFFTPAQQARQAAKQERQGAVADLTPQQRRLLRAELVDRALEARGLERPQTRNAVHPNHKVGTGPVVSIPMTHPRKQQQGAPTVTIPTRPGVSAVKPRKLRIDTSRANVGHSMAS